MDKEIEMKALLVKTMVVFAIAMVFCLLAFVNNIEEASAAGQLQFDTAAFSSSVKHYENNDDEKKLRSLFDSDSDAAHARYILRFALTVTAAEIQRPSQALSSIMRSTKPTIYIKLFH